MNVIKFHPVSDTNGYVVEKTEKGKYQVSYVTTFKDSAGNTHYKKEADARSGGRLHVYGSPFLADYVVRTEILPLYKKKAVA